MDDISVANSKKFDRKMWPRPFGQGRFCLIYYDDGYREEDRGHRYHVDYGSFGGEFEIPKVKVYAHFLPELAGVVGSEDIRKRSGAQVLTE